MVNTQEKKTLLNGIAGYVKNFWYMFSLTISMVATYGYFLTHYAVGIDDLCGDRYYFGELFFQGRYTNTIVHHLFGLIDNSSWTGDFFGLLLLSAAAVVFCVLFDRFVEFKTKLPQTIFSCLLVTAPIFAELFSYNGTCIAVGGGFLCVALALYFTMLSQERNRIKFLSIASVLIAITMSWYESLVVVYVQAIFALFLLEYITAKDKIKLKDIILKGLYFAIPLIVGVIAEFVFHIIVMSIHQFSGTPGAANQVRPFSLKEIRSTIIRIFTVFFMSGIWHKAVAIFLVSLVISSVMCIYYCIKKKSATPLLLFAGLILTNFALSFLSGAAIYRTCQSFSFFTAFTVMLVLLNFEKSQKFAFKKLHKTFCIVVVYLIMLQITTSNYWYFWDYQRYIEETNTINNISSAIVNNYDVSKPIVFTGNYQLSDKVLEHSYFGSDSIRYKVYYKLNELIFNTEPNTYESKVQIRIPQTIVSSYINWGIHMFEEKGTGVFKFMRFHGIDYLKQGTPEMFEEAKELAIDMPRWPEKGSICDVGEYIIVNF